jgi:hypothetical protein
LPKRQGNVFNNTGQKIYASDNGVSSDKISCLEPAGTKQEPHGLSAFPPLTNVEIHGDFFFLPWC